MDHHQQNSDIGNISAVTATRSGYHVNIPVKGLAPQEMEGMGGGGGEVGEKSRGKVGGNGA